MPVSKDDKKNEVTNSRGPPQSGLIAWVREAVRFEALQGPLCPEWAGRSYEVILRRYGLEGKREVVRGQSVIVRSVREDLSLWGSRVAFSMDWLERHEVLLVTVPVLLGRSP